MAKLSAIPLIAFCCCIQSAVTFQDRDHLQSQLSQDCSTPETKAVITEQKEYHVRVRIVIETYSVIIANNKLATLFAISPSDVQYELNLASELFSEIGIKFEVTEYVFKQYDPDYYTYYDDATRYPQCLSIYYMLPNAFPLAGLSSSPWKVFNKGIFISSSRNIWTTAHEIGHYFGLHHTFAEDFCSDTKEQLDECSKENSDNCKNIMNYCSHSPKLITCEQLERMETTLRHFRQEEIITERSSLDPNDIFESVFEIIQRTTPTSQPTTQTSQ